MVQLKNAGNIAKALSVMVQSATISHADATQLTAFVQSSQQQDAQEDDEELSLGAPSAKVYESKSGDILDTLADLMDKAQTQLDEAQKKEETDLHNFKMLKMSLEDEIKFANNNMKKAKKNIAKSGETKAGAEGDLALTSKELKENIARLEEVHG